MKKLGIQNWRKIQVTETHGQQAITRKEDVAPKDDGDDNMHVNICFNLIYYVKFIFCYYFICNFSFSLTNFEKSFSIGF